MTSKNAFESCLEGTFLSPFDGIPLKSVLLAKAQLLIKVEVGTGTGKWVLEVANAYPSGRVVGLDISPIQPTFVPMNVEFIMQDVIAGTDLNDASTDLVHSRYPSFAYHTDPD